ncbi:prostaglandin E2 receptor EP4 subtype-like [Sinocyclocheilus anshuiensis]|uniref:Prostaglandin E2 receptor EP4 subtype-like n=1 Tax=Sinocyclocheilus anshuiensis TaxID=1608454 RepID=A0A671RMH1_9TELE|nr:PREDICTED: prostaglandin E2 receptor EP4 subtype-like [Sinocyclocheilus anshuiensis]
MKKQSVDFQFVEALVNLSEMNDSLLNVGLNVSEANSSSHALSLDYRSLITSATMFGVGVLGNLVAIVVLCISKKEQKETTFYTLVCGMAITDLLGTCFTSPVVIATYIVGRWPGGALLCHFFSFSMLFFGSAGMSILCAMSVERYLAINHAYFYSQHVDRAMARFALMATYLANIVLCILPSFGFGKHTRHFPGTWCFLDWRAMDSVGASYTFLYGGFMLLLIAVTVMCNFAVCRSLVGMSKMSRMVRAEVSGHTGSRRSFRLTSAAEIQMFWLLIFMTIVFLICSIPLVVRIFVNQLYDPAYISSGKSPDYRSDLLAIRFASFNPILDPWVYILCRKNLLTKGCTRLKRNIRLRKGDHSRVLGWMDGQHSPPSFAQSNCTSYASLRTAICRNDVGKQTSTNTKSYVDLTLRQAWDFDTALAEFHPFSVEQNGVMGFDEDEGESSPTLLAKTAVALPNTQILENKAEIVTYTFSTPSSCVSEKCLRQ